MNKEKSLYYSAIGRHKAATAQVRLSDGSGIFRINNREVALNSIIVAPLKMVGRDKSSDLLIKVRGGGFVGQVKAARLAVAKALLKSDLSLRITLKKAGFLTRDPRVKERKKYGLKGARKSPQWSKR